jgi:ligand-binding sensor domain-containing protein
MRYPRLLFAAPALFALLLSCAGQKQPATVKQITNASYVTGIAADGNTAYCSTYGGLVIWDLAARKYTLQTTADGLPSNTLTDVILDGAGKIWVGSDAGAAVREGSSWKVYNTSNGMPSNLVNDLALDPDNTVWAGTDKGVVFFRGGRLKHLNDTGGPGDADIQYIYFDSGKNLWIGTGIHGIFANLQGTWRELSSRDGLIMNTAASISQNWDNSIWACSWAGVNRWDGQGFQSVNVKKNIGTFDVRNLLSTREYLWFFTANGVHAMQGSEWTSYTEAQGLISNNVTCGFVTPENRIFAGTPSGMSLIEKGVVINYAVPNTPFGKDFISLTVDGKNRLFAGTLDGELNIFDSGFWARLPGIDENTFKTVQSTVIAPDGSPVFNTAQGIVTLRDHAWTLQTRDNGVAGNDIRCGVYDRQGKYWVGTSTGVSCLSGSAWSRFRTGHGLPSENVRACALDSNGTVWFGTGGGIVSFSDNKMIDWTQKAGADSIDVLSAAASGNTVFFGTSDGKLIEYDGKSWKSSRKASAGISAILADVSGALWLGTDGTGVLRTGKGGDAKFTMAEGLPSNRVRALAILDRQLVAACYGGIGLIPLEK